MVGGQVEHRERPCQLALPVSKLLGEGVDGEPLALPGGEVAVLNRQGGQGRSLAIESGGVESRQLGDENLQGPAIDDDVVQSQHQSVVLLSEGEQASAESPVLQLEGAKGFSLGLGLENAAALRLGSRAMLHRAQPHACESSHLLNGAS